MLSENLTTPKAYGTMEEYYSLMLSMAFEPDRFGFKTNCVTFGNSLSTK